MQKTIAVLITTFLWAIAPLKTSFSPYTHNTAVETTFDLGSNLCRTGPGAGADGSSKASGTSYNNVRDGDTTTYWSPNGNTGHVAVKWSSQVTSNMIILRELTNSVTSWSLETREGVELGSGSSIGRELRIAYTDISTDKIYLYIDGADAPPQIGEVEVYQDSEGGQGQPGSVSLSTFAGNASVQLSWTISNIDPESQEVYRNTSTDTLDWTLIAQDLGDATSFTDTSLTNDSTYYYWVKIIDAEGNIFLSNSSGSTPRESGGEVSGANFDIIGYAMVDGITTGGQGGTHVVVSTGTALQNAIKNKGSQPLTIYIEGTITPENSAGLSQIDVKDVADISILGLGSGAELNGIGIKMRRTSNIIIRNLKIHHVDMGDKDCISIEGPADHIWVDHCELYNEYQGADKDYYDGLFDIKKDADYITFSWNYLHDSWKCSLSGSSDSDDYPRRVTYHHNYYENVNSRVPLFRFGFGHLFNNYFLDIASTTSNSRMGACLRIENNYYEKAKNPYITAYSKEKGGGDISGNILDNSPLNYTSEVEKLLDCTLNVPYDHAEWLNAAMDVPELVSSFAGVGKITISHPDGTTGVRALNSLERFEVFPNPNKGQFKVNFELQQKETLTIRLVNSSGKLIRTIANRQFHAGSNEVVFNERGLAPDVYFVMATSAKGIKTKRVLVR